MSAGKGPDMPFGYTTLVFSPSGSRKERCCSRSGKRSTCSTVVQQHGRRQEGSQPLLKKLPRGFGSSVCSVAADPIVGPLRHLISVRTAAVEFAAVRA